MNLAKLSEDEIRSYVLKIPKDSGVPVVDEHYKFGSCVGTGGFAAVYSYEHRITGELVAVKLFDDEADPTMFADECYLNSILDHPNIVEFRGFVQDEGKLGLVMECIGEKSVDTLVDERTMLPWKEVHPIILGIAQAIDHISQRSIVHRDVKPANIVLAKDGTPKLIDFGLAVYGIGPSRGYSTDEICGTPNYMSPETIVGEYPTSAVDVYALGITMYLLVVGALPFQGKSSAMILEKKLRSDAPDIRCVPEGAAALYAAMVSRDKADRPTPRELITELESLEEE